MSRSTWVATALAPGSRKMSKHTLSGGDGRKLLDLLARLKSRAEQRIAAPVKVVAIHEVGLDGFWIHRLLEANGVESHVVDPASIAVPRRHRRAKTDAIDGETLLRTLMAWQRGEPRVLRINNTRIGLLLSGHRLFQQYPPESCHSFHLWMVNLVCTIWLAL